jgi:hypothetical protein
MEPPVIMGWPVGEVICGGMGRGACERGQLELADAQDIAECDDMLEKTEACPEDPELVDETEKRGRWTKGAEGG